MTLFLLSLLLLAQVKVQLPFPKLTPGAVRTTDVRELCAKNFSTKRYRVATPATKKAVCAEYGVAHCPQRGKMEIDDLVPLEIGGENVKANLWVQLAPEYHWKDKLEQRLRADVCNGKIGIIEAQRCIRSDWGACYAKTFGEAPNGR